MKKFKALIMVLTITFLAMTGIAIEQATDAQSEPNLQCIDLTNCSGSASCNSSGTVSGCTITCRNGGTITCPPARPGGGDDGPGHWLP